MNGLHDQHDNNFKLPKNIQADGEGDIRHADFEPMNEKRGGHSMGQSIVSLTQNKKNRQARCFHHTTQLNDKIQQDELSINDQ